MKHNEDIEEFVFVEKDEKKTRNMIPIFWKSYFTLCRSTRTDIKWRDNYKFSSIKVFIALFQKKLINIETIDIDASCYSMLDSAFDIYSQNKSKPLLVVDSCFTEANRRAERYATIYNVMVIEIDKIKVQRTETLDIKWEPYWNLLKVIPKEHPLYNILIHQSNPIKKIMQTPLVIHDFEEPSINDVELNSKTKSRLIQWWTHQSFFKMSS
jgi:hypothetical protein